MKTFDSFSLKSLGYELSRGFSDNRTVFILCAVYLAFVQISFLIAGHGITPKTSTNPFTLFDLLIYMHRGMDEYVPSMSNFFLIDAMWIAPFLLIGYLACFYPARDTKGYSIQAITRTGSRMIWYVTKIIWITVVVILFYATEVCISFVTTMIFGDITNFNATELSIFFTGIDFSAVNQSDLLGALALAPITLLAMSYAITAITLAIGPIGSYVLLLLSLVASSYFTCSILFFNFSMTVRNAIAVSHGFSAISGILICSIIAVVSIVSGFLISRRVEYK